MESVRRILTFLREEVGSVGCRSKSRIEPSVYLKEELSKLRRDLGRRTAELGERVARIASDHRCVHPGLLGGVLARRRLQTDLGLLWLVLEWYWDGEPVWRTLANLIVPILQEVKGEMERLDKDIWAGGTSFLPQLDNFLKRYGVEVAPHFLGSEVEVAFTLKLADLLLVCPSGNLRIAVTDRGCARRMDLYFELRNRRAGAGLHPPPVGRHRSLSENQAEILAFLRKIIRESTSDYMEEILEKMRDYGKRIDELSFSPDMEEILSFIFSGDESSVVHRMSTELDSESYEVYTARNVGSCCLRSSFETHRLSQPCNRHQASNTKNLLSKVTCVSCTHPIATNTFELGIMSETRNKYCTEEVLVTFDPDNGNYNLTKKEHWNV